LRALAHRHPIGKIVAHGKPVRPQIAVSRLIDTSGRDP
jgi:hypothetical protein